MALPDEEHEWRNDDRSVHGVLGLLRRSMLRLQELICTQRFSLSDVNGTRADAALSPTVSLSRKSGETTELDRSDEHRARCHSRKCRTERPNVGCGCAVRCGPG